MGWWKIDPASGRKAEGSQSALSQPPDFVLLNAVPGVDGEEAACYLGDAPWDVASTVPGEIEAAMGECLRLSDEQLRDLFLRRMVPAECPPQVGARLLQIADAFWAEIDGCYEDDWERPARPAEKRWVCEYVLKSRTGRST